EARWQVLDGRVAQDISAVAYFFGRDLRREIDRPIGLIQCAWGGSKIQAWLSPQTFADQPDHERFRRQYEEAAERFARELQRWRADGKNGQRPRPRGGGPNHKPSGLYNAMTHPLAPLTIRGVLWYQGESDAWMPETYDELFKALVADWRRGFHDPELPVFYVQLPAFENAKWPAFREAQRNHDIPHAAMAVSIDQGVADDIHPPMKRPVGERLARLARVHVYGHDVLPGGPRLESVSLVGDGSGVVRLRFVDVGDGLASTAASPGGGPLPDFALVGADGKARSAEARIVSADTIEVRSPQVAQPVKVRYAYTPVPSGHLINSERLPASPFEVGVDPG
ncbi:MAG: sialate O-acetylesterase, partial [Planctomycetota bacterium]